MDTQNSGCEAYWWNRKHVERHDEDDDVPQVTAEI